MSFKCLLLLPLLVIGVVTTTSKAEIPKRSVKTLLSSEKVGYPLLAISINAPAGTELLEGRQGVEPINYVFPWLRMPDGSVDLAFESSRGSHLTVNNQVTQSLKRLNEQGISQTGVSKQLKVAGIPMIRVPLEGRHHYPIVRYYFLTSQGKLAYLHLHSSSNFQKLEDLLRSSISPEKYSQ